MTVQEPPFGQPHVVVQDWPVVQFWMSSQANEDKEKKLKKTNPINLLIALSL